MHADLLAAPWQCGLHVPQAIDIIGSRHVAKLHLVFQDRWGKGWQKCAKWLRGDAVGTSVYNRPIPGNARCRARGPDKSLSSTIPSPPPIPSNLHFLTPGSECCPQYQGPTR
ncbi:hypothetical protein M404DRAFT_1002693 [Pisolithus tinctorius Marx 270]|uniref:Uncharacterized protein n=1 Tax=Pisolithus tinctorius Marx 270 TaxID=870435 RepID=A0A0C3P3T9_PISTI|nr:hypothetical protein M404DRAFT_1002693 [Pisolithus tinctorius Marx 270]